MTEPVVDEQPQIDVHLVRRLVAAQFPRWADLPVRRVEVDGVDNRTFRLGDELSVRLPSGYAYRLQVTKEQRWLPVLAPQLPRPVPEPVGSGVPGCGYLYRWSVNRWLPGDTAVPARIVDLTRFATDVAGFLVALRALDPTDGPVPGPHNFARGGPVTTYADEALAAVDTLRGEVDRDACLRTWDAAAAATGWDRDPVWVHGDVGSGNLLVRDGRLSAVIDFGGLAVGDPACDLVLAWTLLDDPARVAWRKANGLDDATWARARGWALWKALITLVGQLDPAAAETDAANATDRTAASRQLIGAVLADHAAAD